MMEDLFEWLQRSEGPLGYLVLILASLIEYVFPPFPGDLVALFGVFLAATAGYHPSLVYLALNVGALAGGMLVYAFGRNIANLESLPGFLGRPRVTRAIVRVIARFEKHGAVYIALNRFVPAFRGVFFLAAGMARLPWYKVAGFGLLSAAVWNALLLALGWLVGDNFDYLKQLLETYSYGVLGVLTVLGLGLAVRAYLRRRRQKDA